MGKTRSALTICQLPRGRLSNKTPTDSQHPICGPRCSRTPYNSTDFCTSEHSRKTLSPPLLPELPRTTRTVAENSLVDSGIVLPLPGEAKHAADDSALEMGPLVVADLLPFAAVLDLHVALRHGDALTVRRQDGSYAHVLHLNIEALWTNKQKYAGHLF